MTPVDASRRRRGPRRSAPCGGRRIGPASATTSSTRGRQPAVEQRAGARRQHQRLARARAGAPGDMRCRHRRSPCRAGRSAPGQDRLDHLFADRQAAHQALRGDQLVGGHDRLAASPPPRRWWRSACCRSASRVGIADVDLQQEAVELGFGQRIGAFLLDRVLGRQHVERARQRRGAAPATVTCCSCIACSSADWVRGLARLISSAISSWQKTGPGMKRKLRRPSTLSSSTSEPRMSAGIRSGVNCTRLRVEAEHDAQRLDQLGLGEAGHADQQRVAAATGCVISVCSTTSLLAEDDVADRGSGRPHLRGGRLRLADDHVVSFSSTSPPATAIRSLLSSRACSCVWLTVATGSLVTKKLQQSGPTCSPRPRPVSMADCPKLRYFARGRRIRYSSGLASIPSVPCVKPSWRMNADRLPGFHAGGKIPRRCWQQRHVPDPKFASCGRRIRAWIEDLASMSRCALASPH